MNHLTLEQCEKLKEFGDELTIPCPTLEELIEWLGEDFRLVSRENTSDPIPSYMALGSQGQRMFSQYGKTPLEAVFALAEAIHGKEKE